MHKKAALICVTRNNAEKLQATLNSLIRNTKEEHYDLFVIDNASSDSTLGIYQQQLADRITVVRSGKNLNYLGGINLGINMTQSYEYVGFLNDNIEVCSNWLENFFDVLDFNSGVAAVGPMVSDTGVWQGYDNLRIKFPDWGLPSADGVDRGNVFEMHKCIEGNGMGFEVDEPLSFFCILLRRRAIDKIGLLDSAFSRLNCGYEHDFCDRLKYLHYKLAVSTKSYVTSDSDYASSLELSREQNKKAACEILASKKACLLGTKKISRNREITGDEMVPFIRMRSFWEPLMEVMPFYNYCAGLLSPSQPFPQFGSFVFNPGKSLALSTLHTPEVVAYAAESEKSILSYCLQNDYTAYIYRDGLHSGIHPGWHKARVLLNHLASHQAMVWLDTDTLILQQQNKVFESIAESSKSLHISRDLTDNSVTPYNSGVVIVKNSRWAMELLEDWDQFALNHNPTKLLDHGGDQKVLCDLLLSKDPTLEFHEVYEMSLFNTDPRFVDEKTFLLHFMSYPSGYRIPWMSYWNARNLNFREADFQDLIHPL